MKGKFVWDNRKLCDALGLSDVRVRECFTDGRFVSFLIQRRMEKEIGGALVPSGEGGGHDLIDVYGKIWEVRTITPSGVYFCPSRMLGTGRHFKRQAFLEWLNGREGFILVDVYEFPSVYYWPVPSSVVTDWFLRGEIGDAKISRLGILELLRRHSS